MLTFRRPSLLPSFLLVAAALSDVGATHHNTSFHGIPGTTNTVFGYDTELGSDPICWLGRSASPNEGDGTGNDIFDRPAPSERTSFPNVLMENFVLAGDVELQLECPEGVTMEAHLPEEFHREGFRPRTNTWYNYTVSGSIRLGTDNIEGFHIISDKGSVIAVQIILCELGLSGFCSPFVHDQAEFRLRRDNITEDRKPGDRHGGTHVHSPYVFIPVDPESPEFTFEVMVPTRVNLAGEFFAIGTVQFYTGDFNELMQYRYDMSNAVEQRVVTYQAEPEILGIRTWVERLVWVVCGTACGTLLYVFLWIVSSLNHNVMRLSKGPFFAFMVFTSIVGCGCAILYSPTSDIFCQLNLPLTLIPMTIVGAITAERLIRINAGVSPLLLEHYQKAALCTMLRTRCCCIEEQRWQGTHVVTLLTLPQVIIQVAEHLIAPREAIVWFNQDESVGRMQCASTGDFFPASLEKLVGSFGVFYLMFLALALLVISHFSRNLPSLLSEARSIFVVVFNNVCAMAIGLIVVGVTREPTSSPEIQFVARAAIAVFWHLNTCYRLVWPKLTMIRRGDTILVNKLIHPQVADNKCSGSKNTDVDSNPSEPRLGQRRIKGPDMSMSLGASLRFAQLGEDDDDCSVHVDENYQSQNSTPFWPSERRILVQDDQTPNRGLLLKMVELQELLYKINTNVTSGLAVDREEWQALRTMSHSMGEAFRDRVQFEWDHDTER